MTETCVKITVNDFKFPYREDFKSVLKDFLFAFCSSGCAIRLKHVYPVDL